MVTFERLGVAMKICRKCAENRELSQFVKNRNKPDGLHTVCKPCTKIYKDKYYKENKSGILQGFRERYQENPEKYKDAENRRRKANLSAYNQRSLNYQKKNKDQVNKRHREWEALQRQQNTQFKIRASIRKHLNNALNRDSVNCIAADQLGCSIAFYKDYLSEKFKDGMNWGNRGSVWSIDHIIPLSSFDLTDIDQLKKASHYTNTQPLYIVDNNKKGGANRGN
ncbi:hypothetical protein [Acinetobacter sp. 99]|uniref:hypothetical protein n=1 Tax=Acinetobacter sp. 99 TaxID=3098765 RepID=UPI00300958C1